MKILIYVIKVIYIFCSSEETGEDGALKKGGNARNKTGNFIQQLNKIIIHLMFASVISKREPET